MAVTEIDLTGSTPNHSSRYGALVPWFVGHTEEGPDGRLSASARDPYRLHGWMKRNEVSYHYVAGNGILLGIVDVNRAAWCALDLNPRTINAVFAGSKASFSREDWLTHYAQDIDNVAWAFVRDAKNFDPLAPVVLGQDYAAIRAGRPGGIDHSGITYGLGVGTHTDMGKHFPWDVYAAAVKKYAEGYVVPPAIPAPKLIDVEAEVAREWLGARVTVGENPTRGKHPGRYAEFDNGTVYWSETTGAYAVPTAIVDTYAQHDFEAGFLGYPIGRHTVLTDPSGQPWGDVQGFEGGAIYRRYGQPGFVVTGAIRERWNRTGFENGEFGWPISNEVPFEGGVTQQFERGTITWSPSGTTALRPQDGPDTIVPDRH